MKHLFFSLLFFIGFSAISQQSIETTIEERFKTELEKENIKSGILHVYSESRDIDIQLTESKEDTISINHPFYTASITKMFTATAIGILKDQNKLNFEDKIAGYLPDSLITNLHVLGGKNYSEELTIANLLQHISGLPDYFTDETNDGSPNIINQLLMKPNKLWSAEELIQFSKDNMKPLFVPGEGYHYTDTEYVILALIIENVSGLSLGEFFKKHIFQPLNMHSSYMNLKSKAIDNKRCIIKFYASQYELSTLKSLSADWGGGGLVSTTHNLIAFLKAFNTDKIVKKETRLAMQNWVTETKGMEYGFGIRHVSLGELTNTESDLQLIGHSGSTASFLWYCPQLDTYISGTFNQLEVSKSALILVYKILTMIEKQ
ncbi:CubicO group peptidase (beta-lactamase class C family) [Mesoflavibacter sabulilitoris]|uniref:Serine hydrolase n=1 Tax=Mesoflavibacter zeaxanthinifaciens subsp. sabulilitoris TaxID=1520893 RepID=A0A2T1NH95_9FLAO|nr:serine hydrolase domain-containing protein [Mesoflavibacter zeaxanthinifaciens]MBB3122748.1 CubicO group peptidase (beta-lactamase class C family) [Mesoflavibacter zeaxanthinifaciens subsp. sabulilitoris]PSG92166.1 serine hydrolase [Mesoflavibacter zeaxanthinifaciens subsp. sabulilitoris]